MTKTGFKFFVKRTILKAKNLVISRGGKYLRTLSVVCTILAVIVLSIGSGFGFADSEKEIGPKELKELGVNFHEVAPGIYRSGLITEKSVPGLKELGVKTVVSFDNNQKRAQAEKKFLEQSGIESILIPWSGWDEPEDEVIGKILSLIEDQTKRPILVHCKHGQERTGVVVACWRITHDGWSAEKAYQEMRSYGFRPFRYGHLKKYVYDFAGARGGKDLSVGSSLERVKTDVLSFFYQLRKRNPFLKDSSEA